MKPSTKTRQDHVADPGQQNLSVCFSMKETLKVASWGAAIGTQRTLIKL
jgi:hypothetical protein